MPDCQECGGKDFNLYDGFFYCVLCQTQSQDVQQLDYSIPFGTARVSARTYSKAREKKKKERNPLGDGPPWTSWQAFNYILKGMTDELMDLGAPEKFETTVLQIWACYLRLTGVAFTSTKADNPKLGFPFRYRDGKVLHTIDFPSREARKKNAKILCRRDSKKIKKQIQSESSVRSSQRSSIKDHYDSMASSINTSRTDNLSFNTSLDSLNASSKSSTSSKYLSCQIPYRVHLTKAGYQRRKAKKGLMKPESSRDKNLVNKTKIVSFLYLALLITESDIGLSDLFRFIREGHLSYAIVSQFLPDDIKFGRLDNNYINSIEKIASHRSIRRTLLDMIRFLKIHSLPSPNFWMLLRRFAHDLLLPDKFVDAAIKLLNAAEIWKENIFRQRYHALPIEAKAIAPLLVLFKLILGMDGFTERHLSQLALHFQSVIEGTSELFVFTKWQQAIECRNTVLSYYYIPHRELNDDRSLFDPTTVVSFLQHQSRRDPLLRSRLYNYYNRDKKEGKITEAVEKLLNELKQENEDVDKSRPNFSPSLNPGITHIQNLISWVQRSNAPDPSWMRILEKDWSSASINYLIDNEVYSQLLQQSGTTVLKDEPEWLQGHMKHVSWVKDQFDLLSDKKLDAKFPATRVKQKFDHETEHRRNFKYPRNASNFGFRRNNHNYWRLIPKNDIRTCDEFDSEVMPLFSNSWSWLLQICSRMLHISNRDIYDEVLKLEMALMRL